MALAVAAPSAAAAPAERLYWAQDIGGTTVERCGLGIAALQLADGGGRPGRPFGVALNSSHVYWTATDDNEVLRCPVGASLPCAGQVVASGEMSQPVGIALSATHIYWAEQHARDDPPLSDRRAVPVHAGDGRLGAGRLPARRQRHARLLDAVRRRTSFAVVRSAAGSRARRRPSPGPGPPGRDRPHRDARLLGQHRTRQLARRQRQPLSDRGALPLHVRGGRLGLRRGARRRRRLGPPLLVERAVRPAPSAVRSPGHSRATRRPRS